MQHVAVAGEYLNWVVQRSSECTRIVHQQISPGSLPPRVWRWSVSFMYIHHANNMVSGKYGSGKCLLAL